MKLLFALLGVALAAHSYLPEANPLSSETEYRFRYEGSLISGLPLQSSDSSLTRLRSEVILQITSEKVGRLQLRKPEIALEESWDVSSSSSEHVPMDKLQKRQLQKEHEELLLLPVRFHYKNGIVSELQFHSDEQPWSANVKRAVVNMIQINLNKASTDDENTWENGFFTAFEKTIEGECEMAYTVVKKQQSTQVVKSVNFEKCERRADYTYNQRFTSECPECDYKMIVPQTVYTYEFVEQELKEIEVRSVYTLSLKQQPLMRTETRARLSLIEKSEIRREIEAPKGEKEELIYSNEWERNVEKFFQLGDEVEPKPFESFPKKVEQIEEFVQRISDIPENDSEAAHMFSRIVRTLRMCTEQELVKVHERIYRKSEQKQKTIIEHALAVAGTKNTIEHLFRHPIKEVSPLKVAQFLKSIQETPYPSEMIAKEIQKLAESELGRREPVIRQSAWLAYGAIVRGIVAPTQEKHFFEGERNQKSKFVAVMKQQWEKADSTYEKILAIKTIANSGVDTTVTILEQIINDKKQPTVVRMEAIDALRLLSEHMPRKVQRILMPIFSNRLEKNEIRMVALNQLVNAKPTLPELSQIVVRMEREPNQHVAAFTYHMLTSLAKSPLPAHRNISSIASTLLRNTQFRPDSRVFSLYKRLPLFDEQNFMGMSLNLGSIIGMDSAIPKDMMASLETILGGNWNKYLAQIGFSQQNVEILFNKVLNKLTKLERSQGSSSRASRLTQSVSMLKDMARKLNISPRLSSEEEPYAMMYIRYKQMDYAVLPIDEQLLNQILEKYSRDGSVDTRAFERLFNVKSEFEFTHAGHLIESFVKMPSTIGLPLSISVKVPTIFTASGKIHMEKVAYGLRLRLQAQPSLVSTHVRSMSLWCPIFEHGVKTLRTVEVATPINIEVEVTAKEQIEIKFRQQMPEEQRTLLTLQTRPVSFVRFFQSKEKYTEAQEKTIVAPKLQRLSQEMNNKWESNSLEFVLSGQTYRQWTQETLLLGQQTLTLEVIPNSRTPKEVSGKIVFETLNEGRMEEPKVEKMLRKEMSTEEGEWEPRSESSRREQLSAAVREMNLKKAYRHRVQITFNGEKTTMTELRTEIEPSFRFIRAVAEVKPENHREWSLKSEVEVVLPRPVSSLEQLKDQKHREVQIFCETKWGSEEKNSVEILAQLEQSKMQRNLAQQPKQLRGLPAHEQLGRAARLNQLKAHINYKLSPQAEMTAQQYFGLLKGYTFWTSQSEIAENEPRRITVKVTSEPVLPGFYNMTIQTPESNLRIKNVRLVDVVPSISRQPKNFLRHTSVEKTECKVNEENRVNTFEDVVFRAPLSTCYTVLAKDCSEEPRYAVLVKSVKKNSEEKKIKIIYDETEYELEMTDRQLKASVNGKAIRRDSELEENNIEQIGDLWVVDLGELVVRFDGYTVKVLLNNSEMDNQCGLCGNSNDQKERKYRTARNEETDDLEEFHSSYILKTEECSGETSQKMMYKEYSNENSNSQEDYDWFEKKQPKRTMKEQDSEDDKEDNDSETTEPEDRIRVQQHDNKICFSLDKVPTCPKRFTDGRSVEKKIRFGCLHAREQTAKRMNEQILQGEDINTSEIKLSYVDSMMVPQACVAY